MSASAGSRPFRFGVASHGIADRRGWRQLARQAEDLGYSSVMLSDHVSNELSPVPAMAIAASVTRSLLVGTLVLANDFRHPAFLAKELASLDVLTNGRLEWGMGAGWLPPDYDSTGLSFDPGPVRADRLIEAVGVMKRLFGGAPVTADGDHYQIAELVGRPVPVQRPHPPLVIGASQPRLLAFAARESGIVSVNPSPTTRAFGERPPTETVTAAMDRQIGLVRSAAGARFGSLEVSVSTFPAIISDSRVEKAAGLVAPLGQEADQILASPHVLIGSVAELCDTLEERRARWHASYWVIPEASLESFAPVVERLAGR